MDDNEISAISLEGGLLTVTRLFDQGMISERLVMVNPRTYEPMCVPLYRQIFSFGGGSAGMASEFCLN